MAARLLRVLAVVSIILATAVVPVLAQQSPNVATLKLFSAETSFMSQPGYLRWIVFQQTGQWITYAEAARVVAEQLSTAGRSPGLGAADPADLPGRRENERRPAA